VHIIRSPFRGARRHVEDIARRVVAHRARTGLRLESERDPPDRRRSIRSFGSFL
jgi:hypothetical protein